MPRKQTKSPNDALSGRAGGTILSPQTLLFGGPPPIVRSDIAILVEDDRIARVDDRDALVSAHPGCQGADP